LYQFTPKPFIKLVKSKSKGVFSDVPNYKKLGEYISLYYSFDHLNNNKYTNKFNERLLQFLGEVRIILENSKPIMLFDDIRFLELKKKAKRGLLENLRKYRKNIRNIWNKFARLFLMKYGLRKHKI
jgi:hypothetical protein